MKDLFEHVFSDLIEFAQRRDLEAERLDKLSDIEHARGNKTTASILCDSAIWERKSANRLRSEANELLEKIKWLD